MKHLGILTLFLSIAIPAHATLTPACKETVKKHVEKMALKINETAHVTGMVSLYGGRWTVGNVVIVRVSDETDPSDYVVVTRKGDRAGTCKVKYAESIADGVLPEVPGLE